MYWPEKMNFYEGIELTITESINQNKSTVTVAIDQNKWTIPEGNDQNISTITDSPPPPPPQYN